MIDLVLYDVDNTTVPLGAQHAPHQVVDAIRGGLDAGLRVGPATGRTSFELERFFEGQDFCYATGVLANGKVVKVDGQVVEKHALPLESIRRAAEIVATFEGCFTCVYPFDQPQAFGAYVVGSRDPQMLAAYARRQSFEPWPVSQVPDCEILSTCIAVPGGQAQVDAVRVAVDEALDDVDVVQPVDAWLDVNAHGVNKATGFRSLMRILDIRPDQAIFFGDGGNDLQIMAETPNTAAVANAIPEVAAAARYHVGACRDFGVAIALRDLAQARRQGTVATFMR